MKNQDRCKNIETMIKNLSSTQLEELFKILQKNKCEYTINNNGIFFNLSRLNEEILSKIEHFIKFCIESKKELDRYENICREMNDNLDVKRDTSPIVLPEEETDEVLENITIDIAKKIAPRMSSSMKYYLLKKKFSKSVYPNYIGTMKSAELLKDEYIIKN